MIYPFSISYIIKLTNGSHSGDNYLSYRNIGTQDRGDDSKAALLAIILFKSTVIWLQLYSNVGRS